MSRTYDLIIRNGLIVDGRGGEPFVGDVAVEGDRIAAIGTVEGAASDEIDARGMLVTPGFIDIHTHYDGQAIWAERMEPSSSHGVTTVVVGNCGVGFAPCREEARGLLVSSMEGVEDIPEVVMAEGLTWEWESFPEFLDAVARRKHDISIAAYIPHSALRVYVMGNRGADREQATASDIEQMAALTRSAMEAGAVGFATSSLAFHRRIDGVPIASFEAAEAELIAIAREVGRMGGVFQIVSRLSEGRPEAQAREDFELLCRISKEGNVPVTFTIAQVDTVPHQLAQILDWVAEANKREGVTLRPQIYPRPVGMVLGLATSANPLMERPTYKALAALPLDQRVAELRKPAVREKILAEESGTPTLPLMALSRKFEQMYPLGDTPVYEPDPDSNVAAVASRAGVTPDELAYDLLLEQDGRAMLLVAMANFSFGSLDTLYEQLLKPDVIVGLGDGGAHYGLISDASYPTFMLSHWSRDRERGRFPIAAAIRAMTSVPARFVGFDDRGELAPGRRADLNVIDFEGLKLHAPTIEADLPAGGKRLLQGATGYRYTIVGGRITRRDGVPTDELPGELVRMRPATVPEYVDA